MIYKIDFHDYENGQNIYIVHIQRDWVQTLITPWRATLCTQTSSGVFYNPLYFPSYFTFILQKLFIVTRPFNFPLETFETLLEHVDHNCKLFQTDLPPWLSSWQAGRSCEVPHPHCPTHPWQTQPNHPHSQGLSFFNTPQGNITFKSVSEEHFFLGKA